MVLLCCMLRQSLSVDAGVGCGCCTVVLCSVCLGSARSWVLTDCWRGLLVVDAEFAPLRTGGAGA